MTRAKSAEKQSLSGTREWAPNSVNCYTGCAHGCRYCYAQSDALRFGRIARREDWTRMQVNDREISKQRRKIRGRIMFPTTHDILPGDVLGQCLIVLRKLLYAGNEILVVTKPHCACVDAIMRLFGAEFRHRISFRFTIGTSDEGLLRYWEPGAPTFEERFAALRLTYKLGFKAGVSMEPLLNVESVADAVAQMAPFVTDTIWVGAMRHVRHRAGPNFVSDAVIRAIERQQTPDAMRRVYKLLMARWPGTMRWKDSYRKVLHLPEPEEAE